MNEKLRKLAEEYGIEISNTPGPKVIENETERLAKLKDVEEIFGLYCDELSRKKQDGQCVHEYEFSTYCGAYVCIYCGHHKGLVQCFCGWSLTRPGCGRKELEEMGETTGPEPEI